MTQATVSLEDVYAADGRIRPHIRTTPLLESPLLNQVLGFRLMVKAEGLQYTGAFKVRGALNNILQLTEEERRRGVCARSAGNHAQGLAYAAQKFGVPAVILMPHDAPQSKVENTRAYGAEVQFYHRENDDSDVISRRLADERGLILVHSYNNLRTIAGQGTIGLEIHQQCYDLGAAPDAIIVNCSGGGLSSGVALTRDLYGAPPKIYVAEPADFDDAARSLTAGTIVKNVKKSGSICDALLLHLGDLTFPILQRQKVQGLSASDEMVQAAMSVAADMFKLVLEPGGAVSIATACLNRSQFAEQTIVAVASGSNVDQGDYIEHLSVGTKHRQKLLSANM